MKQKGKCSQETIIVRKYTAKLKIWALQYPKWEKIAERIQTPGNPNATENVVAILFFENTVFVAHTLLDIRDWIRVR